jgi:hypothetical protein
MTDERRPIADVLDELIRVIEAVRGERDVIRVSGLVGDSQDVAVVGIDSLQDNLKRAVAALRTGDGAQAAVTWPQPIATAPTDGTEFIGYEHGDVYKCCWRTEASGEGRAYSGWWDNLNQSFENPTEWSPLRYSAQAHSGSSADSEAIAQAYAEASVAIGRRGTEECSLADQIRHLIKQTLNEPQTVAEWHPIETAPKSSKDDYKALAFLAWCPDDTAPDGGDQRIVWWEPRMNKGAGCWWGDRDIIESPTHWKPLGSSPLSRPHQLPTNNKETTP